MRQHRSRFFWKLFVGHVVLLTGALVVCVWLIIDEVDQFYESELTEHLRGYATLLRERAEDQFDADHKVQLDDLAKTNGVHELRTTFILADGTVLGDTLADPLSMESHANREEVMAAMKSGFGESTRWSNTVKQHMKYVALPVVDPNGLIGVVRVALPMRSITARLELAQALIWQVAAVALIVAVGLALGLTLMWSRRIERVTSAARLISRGDLSSDIDVEGRDEIAMLARSVNRMRGSLSTQMNMIDRQRRTLQYMLTRLDEGVVVANSDGVVILANPAAWKLLQVSEPATSSDEPPTISALPAALREFLTPDDSLENKGRIERRITLGEGESLSILLARVSRISLPDYTQTADVATTKDGRILVLTDVTELTRATQIKADFVANASHELRTPLTAIRAAIETLISMNAERGATEDAALLDIIDRHSDRLGMMVADLLDLSWLESGTTRVTPVSVDPHELLVDLGERFADRLSAQKIDWKTVVDDGGITEGKELQTDVRLLNMVLNNLVDNAIKFTASGGSIKVVATRCENEFSFSVTDTGVGIPPEDQSRIFERFYQVTRARSGVKRGTGLGLSIVRHAVEQMGGRLELKSAINEGTSIRVLVPLSPPSTLTDVDIQRPASV
ncbi:MAG TPA: ATP-binding protein [Phycisphaerae bacterium]|nr:HAMP domain-containing protein [Phycisphaerales bacterium]HNO78088.1 ATP-binding protein [Phycisphaerae bacterium]